MEFVLAIYTCALLLLQHKPKSASFRREKEYLRFEKGEEPLLFGFALERCVLPHHDEQSPTMTSKPARYVEIKDIA
jgi:hypothetical protein